jgi:hypothetical protein
MTNPPQSPSSPKKTRRIQPKIIGHTAPTPRAPVARGSLRAIAPAARAPAIRPPVGAPGMRGFPRARIHTVARAGNSVTRALREQATTSSPPPPTTTNAAPTPELIDTPKPRPRKPTANRNRNAPARPSVTGRPTTPDEAPMDHAPATERPSTPPLRTTQARTTESTHRAAQARHRLELWQREEPSRPRPSRVLAELTSQPTGPELRADEAAAE